MTESEVRSKCTKFSIKNFITDLPRMLNEAFGTICDCIFSFYDADNGDIHLKNIAKLEASYIDATTVVAQNLRFKGSDGTMYNYNDIGSILEKIEKKISSISNISKSQIDSLVPHQLNSRVGSTRYKLHFPINATARSGGSSIERCANPGHQNNTWLACRCISFL